MNDLVKIKRALISVSDKSNLDELVKILSSNDVEIISSGGTAKFIRGLGYEVTDIQKITGNPEAFSGRMKTLSFQVSSALLFRRDDNEDLAQAKELNIEAIDLVVCNLYPFDQVVKKNGQWVELIENIDIGGPTMIRAAAKNHNHVCVLTNPSDYKSFLSSYNTGETKLNYRKGLALKAYQHTAQYDGMIARELEERLEIETKTITFSPLCSSELRYGENPHQKAWVYANPLKNGLANTVPIQGKALSFNNLLDADAAWRSLTDLHNLENKDYPFGVTVIKHSNPCGASLSTTQLNALELAWAGDPVSAFGSIVCFNQDLSEQTALWLKDKFVEVIIAPKFTKEALDVLKSKKNLRLLELAPGLKTYDDVMVRAISGGLLVQEEDQGKDVEFQLMTQKKIDSENIKTAEFGTVVTKHLRSNAIALVIKTQNAFQLIGAGMGNPNRLVSTQQAFDKAKENGFTDFTNTFLVSDAFFPFRDNIDFANKEGIGYIIQPGGSMRDDESIDACNEHGIAMAFTGRRHFRH